jgi:hypothetical protein
MAFAGVEAATWATSLVPLAVKSSNQCQRTVHLLASPAQKEDEKATWAMLAKH